MPDNADSSAEQQFREFVHARTPALSRTAYLLTGDAHLAEDLVQTALFKAAKAWHRIDGETDVVDVAAFEADALAAAGLNNPAADNDFRTIQHLVRQFRRIVGIDPRLTRRGGFRSV